MNLNDTWTNCLAMWKWIAKEYGKDKDLTVYDLKVLWFEKSKFRAKRVEHCFFCEYNFVSTGQKARPAKH